MSIKGINRCNRLATLLIAALMIGCDTPESNSDDPAAAFDAPAVGDPAARASVEDNVARAPSGAEDSNAVNVQRTVLFIGTSLTAGLGLAREQSFPLLIERRIDAAELPFRVVNAGVSGETSAGALARIDWLLRQPFDVVVLETGANDMLRGVDPAATERNIQAIIDRIRTARPDVPIVLAGMLSLPNLGAEYAAEFEAIYPRLAQQNGLAFVPFLLDGVAGERDLNQSDGVHPTAAGHAIVAATVWRVLEPVLVEQAAEGAVAD